MTKEEAISLATARLDEQDQFENQTVHAMRIDRDSIRKGKANRGQLLDKLKPLIEKRLGRTLPPLDQLYEKDAIPGWLVSFPVLRRDGGIVTLHTIFIDVHDDGTVQEMGMV